LHKIDQFLGRFSCFCKIRYLIRRVCKHLCETLETQNMHFLVHTLSNSEKQVQKSIIFRAEISLFTKKRQKNAISRPVFEMTSNLVADFRKKREKTRTDLEPLSHPRLTPKNPPRNHFLPCWRYMSAFTYFWCS
jgi:hypothetical protein